MLGKGEGREGKGRKERRRGRKGTEVK